MSTESLRKVEQKYGYYSREAMLARAKEADIESSSMDEEYVVEDEGYVETTAPNAGKFYVEIDHPLTPSYTIAVAYNYYNPGYYNNKGKWVKPHFYPILYKFVYGPFKSEGDANGKVAILNRRNKEAGLDDDWWVTKINGKWYVQFYCTTKLSMIASSVGKLDQTKSLQPELDAAKKKIDELNKRIIDLEASLASEKNKPATIVRETVIKPEIITNRIMMTNIVYVTQRIVTDPAEQRAKDMLEKAKIAYGSLPGDPYSTKNSVAATNIEGASASIGNDLDLAQSQFNENKFTDAEATATSVYKRAKEEAMNIYLTAYKALYTSYHGNIAGVKTEPAETAINALDALESEVKDPSGKLMTVEKGYGQTLVNAEGALGRNINREEVYSKKLLDEIDAKRALIPAIKPYMNLSDTAMDALGIDYSEYVAKRGTLTNQATGVITGKVPVIPDVPSKNDPKYEVKMQERQKLIDEKNQILVNDAKVNQYLDLCVTLKKMADKKNIEKYYSALKKLLGSRDVSFDTAYDLEKKYRIIGAASLAILMASKGVPSLQDLNSGNLYVSVYQLNQILKDLKK